MPSPYRDKPVVHYSKQDDSVVQLGHPAFIKPIDHPSENVSNESYVITSKVIGLDSETGEFETLNTKYKPEEY